MMKGAEVCELAPVMKSARVPTWSSAIWIGTLDLPAAFAASITLCDASGYRVARFLVRSQSKPMAFVEVNVVDGKVAGDDLARKVASWNAACDERSDEVARSSNAPSISVVICTRNRPLQLEAALASVLASTDADFEVVVVDNAPDDDRTTRFVQSLDDPRVRVIIEPTPGLAVARNAGASAASGDVIAFTDDDVVVDAAWLRLLGEAFDHEGRVGCVTGIVPSGELTTPTQSYFEQQVHWAKSLTRNVFDVQNPPHGYPLFPFQVGLYGTGANFAMRRAVLHEVGGFDEGLGVGSPAGGGEDIDMFVRVLTGGWQLIYEPGAIVWHRHRADLPALTAQAEGYGLGLGAWLTKIALDRVLLPMALVRARRALFHLSKIVKSPGVEGFTPPARLRRIQILALLRGPLVYALSRRQGRRPRPLHPGGRVIGESN